MVKRSSWLLAILHVLMMAVPVAGALADEWRDLAAHALTRALPSAGAGEISGRPVRGFDPCRAVARFYRYRDYQPAWVDGNGIGPDGALALAAVRQAGEQGLFAADYDDPRVEDPLDGMVSRPLVGGAAFVDRLIGFDLALTGIVLRYAHHRTVGRTVPRKVGEPAREPSSRDLAFELADALAGGRLASFLETLGPQHRSYRALQQGLTRYQRIAEAGGWPAIEEGPKLARGDCGPRVSRLRQRLAASGDAPSTADSAADCFDEPLEGALQRFQRRHGLADDGVAGRRTLAALNVPVAQRLRQIRANLERWRWMPEHLGSRYVLVNIPAFQMQIVEADHVVASLRAVVGRSDRPTPVLASTITYLEINPYWHVPDTIARKDLLPKIQKDPAFLLRENFRVFASWDKDARELDPLAIDWSSVSARHFPFRLRQEPAAHNALGRVKFMFPNALSVYIHDTPAKSLFRRPSRPFSSGCVRVEDPLALAGLLLNRQHWDPARLSRAVASAHRQVVILEEPVPVYLVYQTAWAAADGGIHFGDDIYGRDPALLEAMVASPTALACRTATQHATYRGGGRPPSTLDM